MASTISSRNTRLDRGSDCGSDRGSDMMMAIAVIKKNETGVFHNESSGLNESHLFSYKGEQKQYLLALVLGFHPASSPPLDKRGIPFTCAFTRQKMLLLSNKLVMNKHCHCAFYRLD